jgi:hypothetical protein
LIGPASATIDIVGHRTRTTEPPKNSFELFELLRSPPSRDLLLSKYQLIITHQITLSTPSTTP